MTGTLPVFVLDCLSLQPHTSHFGLADALIVARRMAAQRTYLTGFSHLVTHEDYVTLGEVIGGRIITDSERLTTQEREGLALIDDGAHVWVRPAHDGLRIFISKEGEVTDESYD